LLLLTNDGELAERLTHPRYGIEKEYLAEVAATPTPKRLGGVRAGVMLEDGPARAKSVRLVDARPGRGQVAVVMTEGRKREVRRLLAAVGLPVTRLVRVRIGPIHLGRLKPGDRRDLTADELLALQRAAAGAERRAKRTNGDGGRPPSSCM
jgi:23S rRNA pseudouridine2605 synthase